MRIVEFLEARIGEGEAEAKAAAESDPSKQANYMDEGPAGSKWTAADGMVSGQSGDLWDCEGSNTLCTTPEVADHMARHDPARVLAECAAKRAMIGKCLEWPGRHEGWDKFPLYGAGNEILFALAAVYASHPDYDPDWA